MWRVRSCTGHKNKTYQITLSRFVSCGRRGRAHAGITRTLQERFSENLHYTHAPSEMLPTGRHASRFDHSHAATPAELHMPPNNPATHYVLFFLEVSAVVVDIWGVISLQIQDNVSTVVELQCSSSTFAVRFHCIYWLCCRTATTKRSYHMCSK